jgi:hypothetical protein
MLTNEQIEDLSTKMGFPLEGVYFKDELPKKLKFNTGYVINLQNSEDEDGKDNDGTHWTCLQVNKYPSGLIEPIFFDPYGAPPSEAVKKFVKNGCGKALPYTEKDIQSLMNNACGFYCCALLHYVNSFKHRKKDLYQDVSDFLELFEDLNISINYKKNEFILKHFFQSADPAKRRDIEVITDGVERVSTENSDGVKIPVDIKTVG